MSQTTKTDLLSCLLLAQSPIVLLALQEPNELGYLFEGIHPTIPGFLDVEEQLADILCEPPSVHRSVPTAS